MSITFDHDIAPHLQKGLKYRARRKARARLTYLQYRAMVWRLVLFAVATFWALVGYGVYSLLA